MPFNRCCNRAEEVTRNPVGFIRPALDPYLLIRLAPAGEDADAVAAGGDLVEVVVERLPAEAFEHPLLHLVGGLHVQGDPGDCAEGAQSDHQTVEVGVASGCLDDLTAGRHDREARDRGRFEEEALGLADQVYRVARRLVSSREEAEDLVQEAYARAFRSWQSFQPGTNLRAWLFRILTNLNIDRGRRLQRAPDMQPLEEGDYFLYNKLEEAGDTPEERVDQRLSQDDAVAALSAVPHDFRDVIVLVDIGDFSYADAAQILDIPIGTVMSRLHRGRRILKRELAERTVRSTA